MSKLTQTQQADYALNFGVDRADLKPEVQAEYDRLVAEGREAVAAYDPLAGITQRTSPEVRAPIDALQGCPDLGYVVALQRFAGHGHNGAGVALPQ